jgi:hypothetical protein
VGKIFIKFETPEVATKALRGLAGRKFADRTVVATYFPEASGPSLPFDHVVPLADTLNRKTSK